MTQTILLDTLLGETRLAVIEGGQLCELHYERPGGEDVTGSVYLGRVTNVLPGMNAAFVDIGLEKNGFLYAGDIPSEDGQGTARIERLTRPGQPVLVQVAKVQSGQKGHRLTCRIALPGRAMVLSPMDGSVGISKKIGDAAERERLHAAVGRLAGDAGMGVIVRTVASGMTEAALEAEFRALCGQWADIRNRASHAEPPKRLYSNTSLVVQAVRDRLNEDVDVLWVDDDALYDSVRALARALAPQWADRVRRHAADVPLFDAYRVDAQADKALRKYVWLKSGGSLVIEATEAMTVIDVNTGKFTGGQDPEETIFRLNCEAAEEIVRQLRLRDVGGIVIVDFIDMSDPARSEALLERLRALAAADRNRLTVVGMTGLGLVELTRKRLRRPLSRQLTHVCGACGGEGAVLSHETTARRCIREIWRRRRMGETNPILIELCPPAAGWVRTIGAPEGGRVYLRAADDLPEGTYRLSPADEAELPKDCKPLK